MACYSTIRTKLMDADRIVDALEQAGYKVDRVTNSEGTLSIHGVGSENRRILFTRSHVAESFAASGDTQDLTSISRRYAEIGVRAWAVRNGFSVTSKNGNKITLQNRRS